MAAWLHLRVDIMREFYEQGLLGKKSCRPWCLEAWLVASEERKARYFAEYNEQRGFHAKFVRLLNRAKASKQLLAAGLNRCIWCNREIRLDRRWGPFRRVYCSKRCHHRLTDSIRSARAQFARQNGLPSPYASASAPCRSLHCKTCGAPLRVATTGTYPKYCSKGCRPPPSRSAESVQRMRAKNTAKRAEAARRRPPVPCEECALHFTWSPGQRFCSDACRDAKRRRRHRIAEQARRARARSTVPAVYPTTASDQDIAAYADSRNTLNINITESS